MIFYSVRRLNMNMIVHDIWMGVSPSIDGDHRGNGLVPGLGLFVNPSVGFDYKTDDGIDPYPVEGFGWSRDGNRDSDQREHREHREHRPSSHRPSSSCQTPSYIQHHLLPLERRQPLGIDVSPPGHPHHQSRLSADAS